MDVTRMAAGQRNGRLMSEQGPLHWVTMVPVLGRRRVFLPVCAAVSLEISMRANPEGMLLVLNFFAG